MNDDPIEIDGEQIDETEKAYQIDTAQGPRWFPKSLVTWVGDGRSFTIPEWLAKERDLI
jgi:hypothetical protein